MPVGMERPRWAAAGPKLLFPLALFFFKQKKEKIIGEKERCMRNIKISS